MPFESWTQVNIFADDLFKRDDGVARENLVFEFANEKFRIKQLFGLIFTIIEKLGMHFFQMFQVNHKSQIKFSCQMNFSNSFRKPIIAVTLTPMLILEIKIRWDLQ